MVNSKQSVVVLVLVACGSVLGCSLASPTYITSSQESPIEEDDASASGSAASSSAAPAGGTAVVCSGTDFAKVDLAKLTACGPSNKGGHCYPKGKSPIADTLVACAGSATDVCVPDEIILAEGKPLKSCASIIGPGACVSTGFIPQMDKEGGGSLKQDVCSAGQVCAPCVDPRNGNAPTPFCQPIGVHDADCAASGGASGGDGGTTPAPTPLVGCCGSGPTSNGVCLAESAIPEAEREKTKAQTCSAGNKCVPRAFVEGKPVTCSSILGAGVCMDKCFDEMMSLAGGIGIVSKANCGATELCIPCSLAAAGGGTKVPGCP
jgi:hypothetical protein